MWGDGSSTFLHVAITKQQHVPLCSVFLAGLECYPLSHAPRPTGEASVEEGGGMYREYVHARSPQSRTFSWGREDCSLG